MSLSGIYVTWKKYSSSGEHFVSSFYASVLRSVFLPTYRISRVSINFWTNVARLMPKHKNKKKTLSRLLSRSLSCWLRNKSLRFIDMQRHNEIVRLRSRCSVGVYLCAHIHSCMSRVLALRWFFPISAQSPIVFFRPLSVALTVDLFSESRIIGRL